MTHFRPRRRCAGLLRQDLDGETLLYDEEHHRALCLDDRAARIWTLCDGSRDSTAIAEAMAAEGMPLPLEAVSITVDRLGKARLLDDPVPRTRATVSRRTLIRQLGLAVPAIFLITAPPARAAVSCANLGQSCDPPPCCPGFECGQNTHVCGGP